MSQAYQAWQAAQVKATQSDDQAQGQVNADKVQWENAKSSLAALQNGSTASSAQIAIDESQVAIDQVNVANAQAAVNAATLKAPSGGIVEAVNVTNGEQIASGGTGGVRRLERCRHPRDRDHRARRLRGDRLGERRAGQ